jgi:alkylhydroperoxidase family enzyme
MTDFRAYGGWIACHNRATTGVFMSTSSTTGREMVSDTRIPTAEITGVSGAMVKRFATKMLGQVPAPLGVYWNNRPVLKGYVAISGKARKWEACDPSLKSFAHMAVASLVGCAWCLDFGYFQAHNEHLDLEKAREVPRWRESDVFAPLERDVMAYAEAMSHTPPTVTDELSARLLEQLGAAAMVELTAFIALANFYARSNVAFGIEADGFAAACGLDPLAEPTARPEVASTA